MATSLSVIKDVNLRYKYSNNYINYLYMKANITNMYLPKKIAYKYINIFVFYMYYTRLRNYCVISYRKRGVLNYFKLTRMMFKYYALNKYLNGVTKHSW